MHPADVMTSRTSCYVLPYPRPMSDHSPVAFSVGELRKHSLHRGIPIWALYHSDFMSELTAEFEYLIDGDENASPFYAWPSGSRRRSMRLHTSDEDAQMQLRHAQPTAWLQPLLFLRRYRTMTTRAPLPCRKSTVGCRKFPQTGTPTDRKPFGDSKTMRWI